MLEGIINQSESFDACMVASCSCFKVLQQRYKMSFRLLSEGCGIKLKMNILLQFPHIHLRISDKGEVSALTRVSCLLCPKCIRLQLTCSVSDNSQSTNKGICSPDERLPEINIVGYRNRESQLLVNR